MTSVLLVDDEPDILELLEYEFQESGFSTFTAESVAAAQEIMSTHPIDLVLSDVRMPGGNGLELLKWTRGNQKKETVFFFITGYSDVSLSEALTLGAHGLFAKPIDLQKMLTYASACLKQRHDTGPALRRSTRKQVEFKVSMTKEGTKTPLSGTMRDLSRGGFYVIFSEPFLEPGTIIRFRFTYNRESPTEVSGRAVIRWTNTLSSGPAPGTPGACYGAGAAFLELDPRSSEALLGILTILEIMPVGPILGQS